MLKFSTVFGFQLYVTVVPVDLQSKSKRCPILSGKGDNSGKHFPPQPMTSLDVGGVFRRGAFSTD